LFKETIMDDQSSPTLETLRRDLVRRGLPHDYVERVVGELNDHDNDLRGEGHDPAAADPAAERLGDPAELADMVTAQYRARSFVGRHPVLTFVVAPIPAALLAWVLLFVVGAIVFQGPLVAFENHISPNAFVWSGWAQTQVLVFAMPALVTLVFSRLAYRAGHGWRWQCVSSLILIVLAGVLRSGLTVSSGAHDGTLMIGFWLPPHPLPMVLPVAIAAAFLWRSRRLAIA
jgi:hypothetical protein